MNGPASQTNWQRKRIKLADSANDHKTKQKQKRMEVMRSEGNGRKIYVK